MLKTRVSVLAVELGFGSLGLATDGVFYPKSLK